MGSSATSVAPSSNTPSPAPLTQGDPSTPASDPNPSGMDIDMPESLGVEMDEAPAVRLIGAVEHVDDDFDRVCHSLSCINDLANWMIAQSCTVVPSTADSVCENLITLVYTMTDLGFFQQFISRDDAMGIRTSVMGGIVTSLVNTLGVAAFTAAPEDIQSAKSKAPKKGPKAPSPKKEKGKGKAPAAPTPPLSIPYKTRPTCPLPTNLAAACAAVGRSTQAWIPITNKRKSGLPQEEVLVQIAKSFPASTTIVQQQATSTVTGRPLQGTPSEAKRARQKKFTTQGCSRKLVAIYTSPLFEWKLDNTFNQINGRLGNTKREIRVVAVESSRGVLALSTTDIPDDKDLAVFDSLFCEILTEKAPTTEMHVEVPTSKSSLKINDFLFFGLTPKRNEKGQLLSLTEDQLRTILNQSPFTKDFSFYKNSGPRLTRNTLRSDTGTLWFNIEDSKSGLNMCSLVNHAFMYGKHRLVIAPAVKHIGVPQCNHCWRFGHLSNVRICPLKSKLCSICGETHSVEFHHALATCCCGQPKRNPPILATPDGELCSHNARCINCGKNHCSDDCVCRYWKSRFKGDWIWRQYQEQKVSETFTKFFVLNSNPSSSAGRDSRRIPSQSP